MENEELEPIVFDQLEMADGASLAADDQLLVEKTNEGIVKRVSFGGLFLQEATSRTDSDALLQAQITTQGNTFTEFVVVDSVPLVENMRRHVLYLLNTVNDIYQGYYLIEGTINTRGQIGGRSYTGKSGITVNDNTAEISNNLVTEGGTIGGDLEVNGITEINDDLIVNGDIIQNGSAYETHAEKLYTKKDMIITRENAISPLAEGELTGITAKHYDTDGNDGVLGFDRTGTARVGDKTEQTVTVYSSDGQTFYSDSEMTVAATIPSGVTPDQVEGNEYSYTIEVDDTEPILTRSEEAELQNNDIFAWDSTNKKAKRIARPTLNNTVLTAQVTSSGVDYQWKSGGSGSVHRFATFAEAEAALAIQEGQDGYLSPNSIVVIEEENPYIQGEVQ